VSQPVKYPSSIDLSFLRNGAARRRIAITTVAFAAVGALYGLLGPRWYRSSVTVVPTGQQKPGLSGILGSQLGGVASALDSGGSADVARIAAVLQSTAVSDAVIEKFDLKKRYGERYQESARAELWSHCDVKTLPKPNMVQLSCEDRDPAFLRDLLAFFSVHGNEVFRRVSTGSASEEVRFLERRVSELRQQADEAATRMRAFQERHQIVDLDSQARAVVAALAGLHGQKISKQLELDWTRSFSSRDEATARQLESQIAIVSERLRDLEDNDVPEGAGRAVGTARSKGGVFPVALAVPQLRAEYEKLVRDRKVTEATLIYALERLEGARANEARDVSTFQVLDPPTVPTKRSRPKLLESLAIAAVAGLALSSLLESVRHRTAPPTSGG
jgi:tyrosine-protein kinase Etk/Wzc